MLQTAGIAWLVNLAAGAILMAVVGPWAFLAFVPLGIALVAATGVGAWWWIGYRRSDKQLRHQMLARDGFARGREVEAHVGAVVQVDAAATVRPMAAIVIREVGRANAARFQAHGRLATHDGRDTPHTTRRPVAAAAVASTAGGTR